MAENNAERSLKRYRLNGTHRWTDAETLRLVQGVAEELKNKPDSFEKPTSQVFYKKVAAKSSLLKNIEWATMKNKMRHLRSIYISALTFKNPTTTIERDGPKWSYLQQIFGQREELQQDFKVETSMELEDVCFEIEDAECNVTDEEFFDGDESVSGSHQEMSSQSNSPTYSPLNNSMAKDQLHHLKSTNLLSMLVAIHEKKLEIKTKRYELEKDLALKEIEIKRTKLQQDFEISKLHLESEERIRKYELLIKYKSNT